jgi:hypothetical protein
MKRLMMVALLVATAVLIAAASSSAQDGVVKIGRVDGLAGGDTLNAGVPIRILIHFQNNTTQRCDVSNGFRIMSPDGAVWDSLTIDSIGPINDGGTPEDSTDDFNSYFQKWFDVVNSLRKFGGGNDGVADDSAVYLGAGNPTSASKQLPTTWNDTVLAITVFFHNSDASGKHLCIDSGTIDGLTWKWVGRNPTPGGDPIDHFPTWIGLPGQTHAANGYCFLIYDPNVGVDDNPNLPSVFTVSQNYPNPFNPTTTIDYSVPRKSKVSLAVYNVLGQKVATLVNTEMAAGKYRAVWDGKAENGTTLSSGIYFYKFEADKFVKTNKMVMLK